MSGGRAGSAHNVFYTKLAASWAWNMGPAGHVRILHESSARSVNGDRQEHLLGTSATTASVVTMDSSSWRTAGRRDELRTTRWPGCVVFIFQHSCVLSSSVSLFLSGSLTFALILSLPFSGSVFLLFRASHLFYLEASVHPIVFHFSHAPLSRVDAHHTLFGQGHVLCAMCPFPLFLRQGDWLSSCVAPFTCVCLIHNFTLM